MATALMLTVGCPAAMYTRAQCRNQLPEATQGYRDNCRTKPDPSGYHHKVKARTVREMVDELARVNLLKAQNAEEIRLKINALEPDDQKSAPYLRKLEEELKEESIEYWITKMEQKPEGSWLTKETSQTLRNLAQNNPKLVVRILEYIEGSLTKAYERNCWTFEEARDYANKEAMERYVDELEEQN